MKNLLTVMFCLLLLASSVYAVDAELTATAITRLSHPCINVNNGWQGEAHGAKNGGSGPWNSNGTKIMWQEKKQGSVIASGCPAYATSRGYVWATLSDIKTLGGTAAYSPTMQMTYNYANDFNGGTDLMTTAYTNYLSITHTLPSNFKNSSGNKLDRPPIWSKKAGEENILYGIRMVSASEIRVYRYDTSTEAVETLIATLTDYTSVNSQPAIWGWKNGVNAFYVLAVPVDTMAKPGWLIDISASSTSPTVTYSSDLSSQCNPDVPYYSIHTGRSPDGLYIAQYGADDGVSNCASFVFGNLEYQDNWGAAYLRPVHSAWFDNSNDYYLAGGPGPGSNAVPHITTFKIWQIYFDRVLETFNRHEVLQFDGAGRWDPSPKFSTSPNYHGMIIPTLNKTGTQLMFYSSNNIASYEDHYYTHDVSHNPSLAAYIPVEHWANGIFIADIAPVCTSWTYGAWGECTAGIQTRTIATSSPEGCTGGNPILSQSCEQQGNPDANTAMELVKITTHAIVPQGFPIEVQYTLGNDSNAVTMSVYYDSSSSAFTGTITKCTGLAEGYQQTCLIDTTSIPPGTYYLYGYSAHDAYVNKAYAVGTIVISDCTPGSNKACAGTMRTGGQ